jgi:hypothetical protein
VKEWNWQRRYSLLSNGFVVKIPGLLKSAIKGRRSPIPRISKKELRKIPKNKKKNPG